VASEPVGGAGFAGAKSATREAPFTPAIRSSAMGLIDTAQSLTLCRRGLRALRRELRHSTLHPTDLRKLCG